MSHEDSFTSNTSGNRPFDDVLEVYSSRRNLLKGSLAIAATSFFGSSAVIGRSWMSTAAMASTTRRATPGMSPLDHGKLYVARFNDDGTGDWLELTIDNPVLAAAFSSQVEVLTFARMSADLLGATPMSRPEWTSVAPNGVVYRTLTNSGGMALEGNAANPVTTRSDGHIIRWHDSEQHTGLSCVWDIFVLACPSHGTDASFSDPDGLWVDPDGRVFIQTDGGQKDGLQDQMLVANMYDRSEPPKRLFMGVSSDEITGVAYTPDRRTLFCNSQHPGNGSPAATSIPAAPDGVTIPRDVTFVLTRKDGGIVGS